MSHASHQSPARETAANELFAIQLTQKQALFLAKMLPLRYSLQP
jgi:hypothetical protein